MSLSNNISRMLVYVGVPSAVGAAGALVAQRFGYDLTTLEGARQALIAGLPIAVWARTGSKDEINKIFRRAGDHPYLFPLACAVVQTGFYCLGGLAMEYLTGTELSQKFTSAVGGLEGAVGGALISAVGSSGYRIKDE